MKSRAIRCSAYDICSTYITHLFIVILTIYYLVFISVMNGVISLRVLLLKRMYLQRIFMHFIYFHVSYNVSRRRTIITIIIRKVLIVSHI